MCTERNSSDTYIPQQSPAPSFIPCIPFSASVAAQEENPGGILDILFLSKKKQKSMKYDPYLVAYISVGQVSYICLES